MPGEMMERFYMRLATHLWTSSVALHNLVNRCEVLVSDLEAKATKEGA